MLVLSLLKNIEIIGEAASKVSEEFRSHHPQIPWKGVVAMRHRLIHGYFDINLDVVWATVEDELPALLSDLKRILETP